MVIWTFNLRTINLLSGTNKVFETSINSDETGTHIIHVNTVTEEYRILVYLYTGRN